jgi:hypothetical protein
VPALFINRELIAQPGRVTRFALSRAIRWKGGHENSTN